MVNIWLKHVCLVTSACENTLHGRSRRFCFGTYLLQDDPREVFLFRLLRADLSGRCGRQETCRRSGSIWSWPTAIAIDAEKEEEGPEGKV